MKKSVAIAVGVIIVGAGSWVGASWYTGKRIEADSQKHLADANEKLARALPLMGLRIDQLKYERGIFSTQARYGLSLVKNDKSPADLPAGMVEFDANIEHGPFPKTALSRGSFLPKLAFVHAEIANTDLVKPVFALTKNVSPLSTEAIVSYNGDATSAVQIAAVQITEPEMAMNFTGARIEGSFERATQAVKARMDTDTFSVDAKKASNPAKVVFSGLSATVDSRMGKFGMSVGDSSFAIKRIDVDKPDEDVKVSLDNFNYGIKLSEDDTTISAQAAYESGVITVNDVALGNIQTVIKLANLDGKAVKQISDTYNQLVRQLVLGTEDEGLKDEQFQVLMENGSKLLTGNPSFAIDPISWKTTKGESKFAVTVNLTNPANAKDLTPQELAIQAIKKIDANWVVSKPMVIELATQYGIKKGGLTPEKAAAEAQEQVRSMSGMAEMFNFGKNDGDNIVGKFTFADGAGNLNGQVIPGDTLFSGLLGAAGLDNDDDADDEEETPADAQHEPAASTSNANLLDSFNKDVVGAILEENGITFETTDGKQGPSLVLQPGYHGTTDLRFDFICNDFSEQCFDLVMTATYAPKKTATLKAINAFNQEYRWARAYLDEKNRPVLQMDMNAEGGIGKESLEILINTFLSIAEDFAGVTQGAAVK